MQEHSWVNSSGNLEIRLSQCKKSVVRDVERYISAYLFLVMEMYRLTRARSSGVTLRVFGVPGILAESESLSMWYIGVFLKSSFDMTNFGSEIREEKDRCFEICMQSLTPIRERIQPHWMNATDPATGNPLWSDNARSGSGVLSDVELFSSLLQFTVLPGANCQMALHPRWSSHFYGISSFSNAPLPLLQEAISQELQPKHDGEAL
mgnify:FL=1